jgi:hypothetical protein
MIKVVENYGVVLDWEASPSEGVTGYNDYRSHVSGGCTDTPPVSCHQLNSIPLPCCKAGDTSVEAGNTYYYWVTAVDSTTGLQSNFTNQVTAVIP